MRHNWPHLVSWNSYRLSRSSTILVSIYRAKRRNRKKTLLNMTFCGIYKLSHHLKSLHSLNLKSLSSLNLWLFPRYQLKSLPSNLLPLMVWLIWASSKLCLWNGLMSYWLSWRWYTEALSTNSRGNHGMSSVSTKGPHSLWYKQKMEGYSEATLHKTGVKSREVMFITLKMRRRGYFLLIIKVNSKYSKKKKVML